MEKYGKMMKNPNEAAETVIYNDLPLFGDWILDMSASLLGVVVPQNEKVDCKTIRHCGLLVTSFDYLKKKTGSGSAPIPKLICGLVTTIYHQQTLQILAKES